MSDTEPMDLSLLAEVVALRATLARVEALTRQWEVEAVVMGHRAIQRSDGYDRLVGPRIAERSRCARVLRAALAGDTGDDGGETVGSTPNGGERV